MADYIDRERVIESFCSRCWFGKTNCIAIGGMECPDIRHIKAIPSADVRENVRGHWIRHSEPSIMPTYYSCENCGAVGVIEFNFCPNCGARLVNDGNNN